MTVFFPPFSCEDADSGLYCQKNNFYLKDKRYLYRLRSDPKNHAAFLYTPNDSPCLKKTAWAGQEKGFVAAPYLSGKPETEKSPAVTVFTGTAGDFFCSFLIAQRFSVCFSTQTPLPLPVYCL